MPVVVVAVVFMIPVAAVIVPSVRVMVPVTVVPVSARVRWPVPTPVYPDVTSADPVPISADPDEPGGRHWGRGLVLYRRGWRRTDLNTDSDLARSRESERGCARYGNTACKKSADG
jgi:hypothetical protein